MLGLVPQLAWRIPELLGPQKHQAYRIDGVLILFLKCGCLDAWTTVLNNMLAVNAKHDIASSEFMFGWLPYLYL